MSDKGEPEVVRTVRVDGVCVDEFGTASGEMPVTLALMSDGSVRWDPR